MQNITAVLLVSLALLTGCAEVPKKTEIKEPQKAPEAVNGQWAFHRMYVSARAWSPDALGVKMSSVPLEDVKGEPGTSGAWQVTFASPSKQRTKSFTFSAIDAPGNLREGIFGGAEEGMNARMRPFPMAALKIDSTAAYKTAAEKSVDYLKKNPKSRVFFLLEMKENSNSLAWRVVFGESIGTSSHSVFVDATSGQYLETRH
jgi:uncharacterized protein YceK